MLRRIFGRKREEEAGDWRRLHDEELHNLMCFAECCSGDQVKEDERGQGM